MIGKYMLVINGIFYFLFVVCILKLLPFTYFLQVEELVILVNTEHQGIKLQLSAESFVLLELWYLF